MTPLLPLGQPPDNKLCENDALNLLLDARDRVTEEWQEGGSPQGLLVLAKLTVNIYRLFYPLALIDERAYHIAHSQEF